MDERDIEEKGKDREGKGWGIRIEKVILLGNICNCYFKFIYVYIVTRNQKARRANKAFVLPTPLERFINLESKISIKVIA
jgi:hypothetical protein